MRAARAPATLREQRTSRKVAMTARTLELQAFRFEPSRCFMEECDRATFAQIPLEPVCDSHRPVTASADGDGVCRVGVAPLWRLGKKMLGLDLPLRFRNGLPFHEGVPWRATEAGLEGMAAALALR
jgi:sulfide:quinone oxidoreductase